MAQCDGDGACRSSAAETILTNGYTPKSTSADSPDALIDFIRRRFDQYAAYALSLLARIYE